jgi:hypothetical protein
MICLIDLLIEFEFWLAMDCESISPFFIDQLRRKNVEGTLNHKHASMASGWFGLVWLEEMKR